MHAAAAAMSTPQRRLSASRSYNDDEMESPPVSPRRRFHRRGSNSGGTPLHSGLAYNNDYYKEELPSSNSGIAQHQDYGYDDQEPTSAVDNEPSFMRALRRGSMSREQSLKKLENQLHSMSIKDRDRDRDDRLQNLKDRFESKKKKKVKARRSSISSTYSSTNYSSTNDSMLSFGNGNVSGGGNHTTSLDACSRSNSREDLSLADFSIDLSDVQHNRSHESASLHMSTNTAQHHNMNSKTEQIVESLVWFSFHTPRTVLEDLISHEMDIWSMQASTSKNKKSTLKEYRLARSANGEYALSEDDDDDGSMSSLSDDGHGGRAATAMTAIRSPSASQPQQMITLPKAVERESALLFVDMSGFTRLSTLLDVESLSKVINSYFDMIVSEVILHGGDILKFAGDAFFAEWKVVDKANKHDKNKKSPLADLNASLASIHELLDNDDDDDVPKLSSCVLSAARCGAAIVKKFSDFQVTASTSTMSNAMLNVHCGIGCGHLIGLHVGDYKEDQEEEAVELRREFLILGDPIDQVSAAAEIATDGQVMVSPAAMLSLAYCVDMSASQRTAAQPVCIAAREQTFVNLGSWNGATLTATTATTTTTTLSNNAGLPSAATDTEVVPAALQPYESLRIHCNSLSHTALARLHLQMALYVHPVIRGDEMALSAAIQAGKISQPTETLESRHRAEAELRSVFTIFIKAVMSPRITGVPEVDGELYKVLGDIMHVTSRELDRYSGHLRQFIVDDKGVVLIATFGLRGSTFPNMVTNNGLPAAFAIHRALKQELHVENRIGATFGKVYCGVVGGVRRHEFAVMGAPVNLAARLCNSKVNKGILVDDAVRAQVDARYQFTDLPPVQAKGYDHPVPISEPALAESSKKKRQSTFPFVGRDEEKSTIVSICDSVQTDESKAGSAMVFLMGESGTGKSALAAAVISDLKHSALAKEIREESKADNVSFLITAKATSTETEQRIPLSTYRKVFLSLVRDLCDYDGTPMTEMDGRSVENKSLGNSAATPTNVAANSQNVSAAAVGRRSVRRRVSAMNAKQAADVRERPHLTRSGALKDFPDGSSSPVARAARPTTSSASHRLSKVGQGEVATRKSQAAETLGQSLSRLSHPNMRHSSRNIDPFHMSSRTLAREGSVSQMSVDASVNRNHLHVPYFEKLCGICAQIGYAYEYADIVGSQFLNLDGASAVTHVDGHIPTMDELVKFLAEVFGQLIGYTELAIMLIDDFQWVDAFSWKVFQLASTWCNNAVFLCAMRSHDKQALRRFSTAANRRNQSHGQTVEISLGPLDWTEIRDLMAKVLGFAAHAIPETLCADVFQRTGGLPVYVVQLLENIKRVNTVELGDDGMLQWNAAGLKEKRAMASSKSGAVMEETFLSRFDVLDVRVRKVLQTCAVLGLSFALSDVIQVHPEMEPGHIEKALSAAVEEMVLIEQVEDDDEASLKSGSGAGTDADSHTHAASASRTLNTDGTFKGAGDRFFQFSHAMWRKNVLTTMLKERKIELHRLIALSMEKTQENILEESDISRLLTLFDHWKSCGDFLKSAPLALAAGARLEEWDLSAQSLELYEDALEMSFDSVLTEDGDERNTDWIQVSAKPRVLDMILRLHIRVGICHQRLGDTQQSITTFEDAYNIIKTSSKIPGMSKSLLMPIISSLCVLKMEDAMTTTTMSTNNQTKSEVEKLLRKFVKGAQDTGTVVDIGRSLSMLAMYHARSGDLKRGLKEFKNLQAAYSFEEYSFGMITEYGRDFAMECFAESATWHYLLDDHNRAAQQVDHVIAHFLPMIDPLDMDTMMHCIMPIMHVLKLLDRVPEADVLLKKYVINPAHDHSMQGDYWAPLFNPLAYLLELMLLEESEQQDEQLLHDLEVWVMNEQLDQDDGFDPDLERKAHTLMGEVCWRLANFKEDNDHDDASRALLLERARALLTPIAKGKHSEIFLKHTAQALLDAL